MLSLLNDDVVFRLELIGFPGLLEDGLLDAESGDVCINDGLLFGELRDFLLE